MGGADDDVMRISRWWNSAVRTSGGCPPEECQDPEARIAKLVVSYRD